MKVIAVALLIVAGIATTERGWVARIITFSCIIVGALLLALSAQAAPHEYCILWAREHVRIELIMGDDPDMRTADDSLIELMLTKRWAWCLNQEVDFLNLPQSDLSSNAAWIVAMSRTVLGKQGTVPATDNPDVETGKSGFVEGSSDWVEWCRDNYRTFDEETRTVIRYTSKGKRVPCPG